MGDVHNDTCFRAVILSCVSDISVASAGMLITRAAAVLCVWYSSGGLTAKCVEKYVRHLLLELEGLRGRADKAA